MTDSSPEFPWSDEEIRRAIVRRAIPNYTKEELKVLRDLAEVGATHILARRAGGQKRRTPAVLADIRRILVKLVYRDLAPGLQKTPTGARTIARIRDVLAEEHTIDVSEDTIRRDIREIGTSSLRKG
jgi:hypothetical protein